MTSVFEWFANNPWATALLMVLFIGVSTLMVLAILIQRPQGGGLSAAFGGSSGGSGQTAFGTKTGDALTWFTISVFATFLAFGIILNYATTPVPHSAQTAPAAAPSESGATDQPATGTAPAPTETKPADSAAPASLPASVPASAPATQPPTNPAPVVPPTTAPSTSPVPAPASAPTPAPSPTPVPANPAPKN